MEYTDTHEWIRLKGDIATIGISAYAQDQLGEIIYVELPQVGKKLSSQEEACILESTKAATDIYSPLSGTVLEVNTALIENPSLINTSPEDLGWLFKLKL